MSKRYVNPIFRPNKIVMGDDSTMREIEWRVEKGKRDKARYNPRLVSK